MRVARNPIASVHILSFAKTAAKHLADEATTKRSRPSFFHQWSVADLSAQSDYWLGKQDELHSHDSAQRKPSLRASQWDEHST